MKDSTTAFIDTGIPMLAAALAQKTHAPNLVSIFEFGGTGALLEDLPLAVGERPSLHRASAASAILDVVETAQRGFIDYGFLGGARIDPYGNLNSTLIGDLDAPKVRLPGNRGGNDVGSHCWHTIAIMQHDFRRFAHRVDFITTLGYLTGPGAREEAGLPRGSGPYRVVTPLTVLCYHPQKKRKTLLATQPDVSVEQVQENTGFSYCWLKTSPKTLLPLPLNYPSCGMMSTVTVLISELKGEISKPQSGHGIISTVKSRRCC